LIHFDFASWNSSMHHACKGNVHFLSYSIKKGACIHIIGLLHWYFGVGHIKDHCVNINYLLMWKHAGPYRTSHHIYTYTIIGDILTSPFSTYRCLPISLPQVYVDL
jgi:hypothetical protein